MLVIFYSPNAFYKIKWEHAEKVTKYQEGRIGDLFNQFGFTQHYYKEIIGDCASIPTSYWRNLVMDIIVYIDFAMSSFLPFSILLVSNIFILKGLYRIERKVLSQSYMYY